MLPPPMKAMRRVACLFMIRQSSRAAGRAPNSAVPTRTIVAPSAMAISKSSLMPIDSVSIVAVRAAQCVEQGLHATEGVASPRGVRQRGGDRHQPAQREARLRRRSHRPARRRPRAGSRACWLRRRCSPGSARSAAPRSSGRAAASRGTSFARSTVCTQSKACAATRRLVGLQVADQVPLQVAHARPVRPASPRLPARSSRRRRAGPAAASAGDGPRPAAVLLTASRRGGGRPACRAALSIR